MKSFNLVLLALTAGSLLACSKNETAAQPEPDLTGSLPGVYTLTKLTNKDAASPLVVSGTGSATVVAVDKSTVSVRTQTLVKRGTNSTSASTVQSDYRVARNGNDFVLSQAGAVTGTISGNKLTRDIVVDASALIPTSTSLTAEFTK